MDKADASSRLFGLIQWEEIVRSGVFLNHHDVSISYNTKQKCPVLLNTLGFACKENEKFYYLTLFSNTNCSSRSLDSSH